MLFRRGARELEGIVFELEQFLKNNYKDQAHAQRKKLGERCEQLYSEGKIKEKEYLHYHRLFLSYTERMKDYRH